MVAIVATNPEGHILTWNPAAEHMFGYPAAAALGQHLDLIIAERYRHSFALTIKYYQDLRQAGIMGETIEICGLRRDGAEFPTEISLTPWDAAEGKCFTIIIRDITAQKQGETALRTLNAELERRVAERTEQYMRANETLQASEQRYRQVVEDTAEVIFRTDVAGRWTLLNPAWAAITGFSVAESLGKPFIDYVHVDDRERNMALFRPLITREKAYCRHEVRYATHDGGYRWVEVFARLTVDAAGAIIGTCGTLNDITERREVEQALHAAKDQLRQANNDLERRVAERTADLAEANLKLQQESVERTETERQLRESEERFRQIAEHVSEVFYIVDLASQQALYISPSYERVWGQSRASLYADISSFIEPVHPDDRHKVIAALPRQAQGETTEEIYRLIAPDGTQRWIRDRAFPVHSQHGSLYRVVGLAEDITEQRAAEQQIRQANETLERRVIERTAALSEANSELERAARLKDEFLANMSHELRTPLNTILTLTEAVTEGVYGSLSQRQHHALDAVTESGQHLLALINDILDLTKIESGKVELVSEPVEVEELCAASLRMIQQLAHTKQLRLRSSIDPHVDLVAADPRRLKQILVNMLSNAVKFTPEGGCVSLEVSGDHDAEVVRFTVEDTGIGIDAADIPRLFKPFVQLDSRLSRRHEGTGLGLVLVAHLAELHGGGVSVVSTPGQGSRFTLTLPWRTYAEHALAASAPARAAVGPGAHETPLVLLAEDNELVRHTTADYLKAHGYDVRAAHNGAEAVAMSQELRPEIILMDIHMPVMDGLEAIRQIRADLALAAIPIIALTALAMVGDRERCLAVGSNDYLSKPVTLSHLVARIEALRSERRDDAKRDP
jgi:PAS domain S-box-containing protein